MAATVFGVNDALAVKLWSKMLEAEVLKNTWAERFMGTSRDSLIQIKDETSKSAGDKITYGLRMQLTGGGVAGDATLQGNEEALTRYSDSVIIDQLRHAVKSGGKMTEQRVPFSIRDEAMSGLRDWWTDRIDTSFFNQICGYTPQSDTKYTGMNAMTAPDSSHIIRLSGEAADQSVSTTSLFTLSYLDKAVEKARTLTPAIRPIRLGGKSYYVAFLHPYQVTDMRISTTTGQWLDIQKAAMTGGEVQDNPIFDGSLGVYNGVVLHQDTRVTQGVSGADGTPVTGVRRAVFCGAQAAMMAYGRENTNAEQRFSWVEETFDYKNQLGVSAGQIFGMKKTVYNATDFSTIVLASYAVSH